MPWRESDVYKILKQAADVLADSDKPWRLESFMATVPDTVGVSSFSRLRLENHIKRTITRKRKEMYQYELAKFALGETNDLAAAGKNAESLGRFAYEKEEEQKMKAQANTQYPPMRGPILQQYNNYQQHEQMKKMQEIYEKQTIDNKFAMYKSLSRSALGMSPEQYLDMKQNKLLP